MRQGMTYRERAIYIARALDLSEEFIQHLRTCSMEEAKRRYTSLKNQVEVLYDLTKNTSYENPGTILQ